MRVTPITKGNIDILQYFMNARQQFFYNSGMLTGLNEVMMGI